MDKNPREESQAIKSIEDSLAEAVHVQFSPFRSLCIGENNKIIRPVLENNSIFQPDLRKLKKKLNPKYIFSEITMSKSNIVVTKQSGASSKKKTKQKSNISSISKALITTTSKIDDNKKKSNLKPKSDNSTNEASNQKTTEKSSTASSSDSGKTRTKEKTSDAPAKGSKQLIVTKRRSNRPKQNIATKPLCSRRTKRIIPTNENKYSNYIDQVFLTNNVRKLSGKRMKRKKDHEEIVDKKDQEEVVDKKDQEEVVEKKDQEEVVETINQEVVEKKDQEEVAEKKVFSDKEPSQLCFTIELSGSESNFNELSAATYGTILKNLVDDDCILIEDTDEDEEYPGRLESELKEFKLMPSNSFHNFRDELKHRGVLTSDMISKKTETPDDDVQFLFHGVKDEDIVKKVRKKIPLRGEIVVRETHAHGKGLYGTETGSIYRKIGGEERQIATYVANVVRGHLDK